jgi:DNA-binding transcriptional MerR regulator
VHLLRIGPFSRLTGVPVTTLRHWDELGVLVPAATDRRSGYRHDTAAQLATATTVRLLRALELPLDEIGALLAADGAAVAEAVGRQAERLAARAESQSATPHRTTTSPTGTCGSCGRSRPTPADTRCDTDHSSSGREVPSRLRPRHDPERQE